MTRPSRSSVSGFDSSVSICLDDLAESVAQNCRNLAVKTNLKQLTISLVHMLNDSRSVIRSEVQHVIVLLSYSMSLKITLAAILTSLVRLIDAAKPAAIKIAMIVYLTHEPKNQQLFETDRKLLLQLVSPIVSLVIDRKPSDQSLTDIAIEMLVLLADKNQTQVQEILIDKFAGTG